IFGCGMMVVQLLKSLGLITIQGGVLGFVFQNSIYSGVIAMVAGLIIVPVVSLLTRKGIPAGGDDAFACYEKKVIVSQKTSLTD
ncbi:MAG: sodium:solute symporter, partial [Oscillospiraceae bacterium]|nr:sodium:solute symporter [Oscillospiraceae bacterium]